MARWKLTLRELVSDRYWYINAGEHEGGLQDAIELWAARIDKKLNFPQHTMILLENVETHVRATYRLFVKREAQFEACRQDMWRLP